VWGCWEEIFARSTGPEIGRGNGGGTGGGGFPTREAKMRERRGIYGRKVVKNVGYHIQCLEKKENGIKGIRRGIQRKKGMPGGVEIERNSYGKGEKSISKCQARGEKKGTPPP